MKRKYIFILTILFIIGGYILVRYRYQILAKVDSVSETYYSFIRNMNNQKIRSLPILANEKDEWYFVYSVIAHGGGGIDGKTCTNSQEAIDLAYKNGTRLFDIDIRETTDSVWVCRHSWNDNIEQYPNIRAGELRFVQWDIDQIRTNLPLEGNYSLDSAHFFNTRPFHKYTPISLSDFLDFMRLHDDVWMLSDYGYYTVQNYDRVYKLFFEQLPHSVQERIVVTFNHYEEAAELRRINSNVKLHLKRYGMKSEQYYELAKFCVYNKIHAVNISLSNIDDKAISYMNEKGIHVFVAAVDYLSDYQYCINQGASGVVSNFLFEDDIKLLKNEF